MQHYIRTIFLSVIVLAAPAMLHSQQILDTSLTISAYDVLFDSDKAFIRPQDSMRLLSLIDTSSNFDRIAFTITAHTDGDGGNEYNERLSARRSSAITDFLRVQGIDSTTIKASHHGEKQPISDNVTDTGKQMNRRATVTLEFQIPLIMSTGIVIDDSTNLPIHNAQVILRSKHYRDTTRSNQNGYFRMNMPGKTVVGLDVSAKLYLGKSEMLKISPEMARDTKEVRLSKLIPGIKINLNEFHFVGSKAILLPRSDPELKKLKQMMSTSEQVCIEIIGHVNYPNRPAVGQNTFEYNLSVARSKLIYEQLVAHRISRSRMFYSGRGNWEMIYPNARGEKEMQLNRRVEVLIQECGKTRTAKNADLDDRNYNFY